MKFIYNVLAVVCILFNSCKNESPTEKHLKSRNNIVDVHDRIIEISMEDTPISYNMDVRIGGNKIYALYSGEDHRTRERYPSKIVIFDCDGNYLT